MSVQRAYSTAAILRMEHLCAQAFARPKGIKVLFTHKHEALKLRQQLYSARATLFRNVENARTPLATAELEVAETNTGWFLWIRPQYALMDKLVILDGETEEGISVEGVEEEDRFMEVSLLQVEGEIAEFGKRIPLNDVNKKEKEKGWEAASMRFDRGDRAKIRAFPKEQVSSIETFVEKDDFALDPKNLNLGFEEA